VAIYNGYIVLGGAKKVKKRVVIADFLKIKVHLKTLSVQLKGIPEGDLKAL
jgi:hypothetical protein